MTLSQKFFNCKQAQQKVNHCSKKKRKGEKGKAKKISKNRKALRCRSLSCPKTQNFDFCTCPSHNVVKCDASGKQGKLLCCKRIFDRIKDNLAEIQPENHQNVKKTHFFAKSSRSQWVNKTIIPFALVGYEIGYSQHSPTGLVGYLPSHIQCALMEYLLISSSPLLSWELLVLNPIRAP